MAIKTSFARWVAGAAVSAVGLWSISAFADVPATLTQQGRILDATTGDLMSRAQLQIVFNVYAAAKGGTALWTEQQNITLDDGYFSAQLGSVTPIPDTLFDGTVRYLGVTVGSDAEMTPRQAVTSVPYAMKGSRGGCRDERGVHQLDRHSRAVRRVRTGMYLKGYSAVRIDATVPRCRRYGCVTRYAIQCGHLSCKRQPRWPSAAMTDDGLQITGRRRLCNRRQARPEQQATRMSVRSILSLRQPSNDRRRSARANSGTASIPCCHRLARQSYQIISPICEVREHTGKWTCAYGRGTASIRAYATCCTVK